MFNYKLHYFKAEGRAILLVEFEAFKVVLDVGDEE
jgi:hypothetical protein